MNIYFVCIGSLLHIWLWHLSSYFSFKDVSLKQKFACVSLKVAVELTLVFQQWEWVLEQISDGNGNKELLWSLDLLLFSSPMLLVDFHSALRCRSVSHAANRMASFKGLYRYGTESVQSVQTECLK